MSYFIRILSIALLLVSLNVAAWDGNPTGVISTIDVAAGDNYGFRVALKDSPKLCGNRYAWAYLNESDSNYKTYISVLLAAKMSSNPVVLYVNRETASGNGYCHIGYIVMR